VYVIENIITIVSVINWLLFHTVDKNKQLRDYYKLYNYTIHNNWLVVDALIQITVTVTAPK